jgi:mono/diheme cytochrome c family protein
MSEPRRGINMHRFWIAIVAVAFLNGGLRAQPHSGTTGGTLTSEQQQGRRIFQTRCAMCHVGAEPGTEMRAEQAGAGVPSGPVLSKARLTSEAAVRDKIRTGGPRMPGYQYTLKEAQIAQLIAYLKTLDAPLTRLAVTRPGE